MSRLLRPFGHLIEPWTRGEVVERYGMWALVGAVTLLGLALRLAGLHARPVWTDEAYTLFWASYPLAELPGLLLRHEAHPPLFYALMHVWAPLGADDALLRLPSAVLGAAAIPLVYAAGRGLAGRRLGLLAALLLATDPLQVWYGQEARPYALLTTLTGLVLLLLLLVMVQPTVPTTLAYALAAAALPLTHYAGALVLLGLNVAPLVSATRRAARPWRLAWLAGNGLIVLPAAPWALAVAAQVAPDPAGAYTFSYRVTPPDLVAVRVVLTDLLILAVPYWRLPGERPEALLLPLLALAGLGAWRLRGRGGLALAGALLVALAGLWLLAQRYPAFFQTRTAVPLGLLLALLLAGGLLWLWERWRAAGLVATGLLLLLHGIGLGRIAAGAYPRLAAEDWRTAAQIIAARAAPDDLLLFLPAGHVLPYERARAALGLPPRSSHGLPIDFSRAEPVLDAAFGPPHLARLDDLLQGRECVWLVTVDPAVGPHLDIPFALDALAARAAASRRFEPHGIVIYRYLLRGGGSPSCGS